MKDDDDAAAVTSKNCATKVLGKAREVEIQRTNGGTGLHYNRGEGREKMHVEVIG